MICYDVPIISTFDLLTKGAFDGQDRETGYDTLIISSLNLMFDAPKG
jgi:hypothetical protein